MKVTDTGDTLQSFQELPSPSPYISMSMQYRDQLIHELNFWRPRSKKSEANDDGYFSDISSLTAIHKRRSASTYHFDSCFPTDRYEWFTSLKSQLDGPLDDSKPMFGAKTLPRVKKRPAHSTARRRLSVRALDISLGSTPTINTSRSPDRFLAPRRPALEPSSSSFQSNKDPNSLSFEERLRRDPSASLDAFNPRINLASGGSTPKTKQSHVRPSSRRSGGASVLSFQRVPSGLNGERQVSVGTVWAVGGLAPVIAGVPDGRGRILGSGTNARLYASSFANPKPISKIDQEIEQLEGRLAQALDLDRISRVFEFRDRSSSPGKLQTPNRSDDLEANARTFWNGTEWVSGKLEANVTLLPPETRTLPFAPFKVLDAPGLRDDFYCSVLAYSHTCHTLAVGLGSLLYGWSELQGVRLLAQGDKSGPHLTSLAFSSTQGCKAILAFGRSDGSVTLMSLYEGPIPRFQLQQPSPIACITWRPMVELRKSRNPHTNNLLVKTEDLLVGDEVGNIYYYAVEWPEGWEVARDHWSGSTTLLLRISVHTQQICGLSFSNDGTIFATGGNDNLCCLFETGKVLGDIKYDPSYDQEVPIDSDGVRRVRAIAGEGHIKELVSGSEKRKWVHGAAVKAIAFCPWRDGLLATGGGSNDKCIHFYHTSSGACLATISVAAQVTSLMWSTTRREICATFGFAQPDHPYRIAVFSWPDCKQVAAIAWEGEHRALYAIAYPGGPNESRTSKEGSRSLSRTSKEGCIVVASSDESVKFHEVWCGTQKSVLTTACEPGLLGGSDILEGLEGIDKEGDIIH